MRKIFLHTAILLILLQSVLTAQTFESSVDKTTVSQYERFQVYFTFNGDDINSVQNFRTPAMDGLRILGGPNQSTNMQYINGRMSASLTYSYVLQASEVGEFTIGPGSVVYKGKTYSTKPLKIKVVKGNSKQGENASSGGVSDEELSKNVFIVASANKKRVFKGEQIIVTYKLLTRLNISSPSIQKLPSYKGFWAEDLEMPKTLNFEVEMHNGQRFRSAVIKRAALFPTRSGDLEITPFELKVPVLVKTKKKSGDIFDDFFNDPFFGRTETVEYTAKSNPIKIKALPLPSNSPASFTGAVGNFNLTSSIDKKSVKTNEAVTLKLSISGKGNVELLDMPKVNLPPGFEIYDPKISDNISKAGSINGSKTVEYVIVPRAPGNKEIPSIEFSYFDPVNKKYRIKRTPKYSLEVIESDNPYETNISGGFSKEDVKLLSQDIRFIKTAAPRFIKRSGSSLIQTWFWFALVLPLILFAAVLGVKQRRNKLSGNVQLMKFRKAEKAARQRLKLAKKALDAGDKTVFYSELSQSLSGYLEDKLAIQKSDFTIDRAVNKLEIFEIDPELVENLKGIFGKCEFIRFAPQVEGMMEETKLYDDAVQLIVNLDDKLSRRRKK